MLQTEQHFVDASVMDPVTVRTIKLAVTF